MSTGYSDWLQKPRAVWGKISTDMMDDVNELKRMQEEITDDIQNIYIKLLKDNNLDPDFYHLNVYIHQSGDDFAEDKWSVTVEATPNGSR